MKMYARYRISPTSLWICIEGREYHLGTFKRRWLQGREIHLHYYEDICKVENITEVHYYEDVWKVKNITNVRLNENGFKLENINYEDVFLEEEIFFLDVLRIKFIGHVNCTVVDTWFLLEHLKMWFISNRALW